MCSSGKGIRSGKKALRARCSITDESLPIEYSSTCRSNYAAVSRRMWMDSASSARECDRPHNKGPGLRFSTNGSVPPGNDAMKLGQTVGFILGFPRL